MTQNRQNIFGARWITALLLSCLVGLGASCGGMEEYEEYEDEGDIERTMQKSLWGPRVSITVDQSVSSAQAAYQLDVICYKRHGFEGISDKTLSSSSVGTRVSWSAYCYKPIAASQSFKGRFTRGDAKYYSNGKGAYCVVSGNAKILNDFKRFDGICKGDFEFRGRGGYSNGGKHLCWYSSPRGGGKLTSMPGVMKDDGNCK